VEEVLFQHPKVLEAAVVGVPDPYRGEMVKAFVVLKPGETATAEEIISLAEVLDRVDIPGLREELVGLQYGTRPDSHGWIRKFGR